MAASDSSDNLASFSNFGKCVDIVAPGVSITSAWKDAGTATNTATNTLSGTSMAAPHAAGVAALYLQGHATASPSTVADAIANCATKDKINPGLPNRRNTTKSLLSSLLCE